MLIHCRETLFLFWAWNINLSLFPVNQLVRAEVSTYQKRITDGKKMNHRPFYSQSGRTADCCFWKQFLVYFDVYGRHTSIAKHQVLWLSAKALYFSVVKTFDPKKSAWTTVEGNKEKYFVFFVVVGKVDAEILCSCKFSQPPHMWWYYGFTSSPHDQTTDSAGNIVFILFWNFILTRQHCCRSCSFLFKYLLNLKTFPSLLYEQFQTCSLRHDTYWALFFRTLVSSLKARNKIRFLNIFGNLGEVA